MKDAHAVLLLRVICKQLHNAVQPARVQHRQLVDCVSEVGDDVGQKGQAGLARTVERLLDGARLLHARGLRHRVGHVDVLVPPPLRRQQGHAPSGGDARLLQGGGAGVGVEEEARRLEARAGRGCVVRAEFPFDDGRQGHPRHLLGQREVGAGLRSRSVRADEVEGAGVPRKIWERHVGPHRVDLGLGQHPQLQLFDDGVGLHGAHDGRVGVAPFGEGDDQAGRAEFVRVSWRRRRRVVVVEPPLLLVVELLQRVAVVALTVDVGGLQGGLLLEYEKQAGGRGDGHLIDRHADDDAVANAHRVQCPLHRVHRRAQGPARVEQAARFRVGFVADDAVVEAEDGQVGDGLLLLGGEGVRRGDGRELVGRVDAVQGDDVQLDRLGQVPFHRVHDVQEAEVAAEREDASLRPLKQLGRQHPLHLPLRRAPLVSMHGSASRFQQGGVRRQLAQDYVGACALVERRDVAAAPRS